MYIFLMWLADRLVWLACFWECPRNPESVRRDAIKSMEIIQDSDLNRLFGGEVCVTE
jgi:hypothetical protein